MNLNFFDVLINVLVLVCLCLPGYLLKKKRMVGEGAMAAFSAVLIYVNQPFITLSAFLDKMYEPALLGNIGLSALFSLLAQALMLLLVRLIFLRNRLPLSQSGVLMFSSVFSNCGFMGIPVLKLLFPDNPETVIYAAIFLVTFNILVWTLGIWLLTGETSTISLKSAFLNPACVTLIVALPLFFFRVDLHEICAPLAQGIDLLGNMSTPVSMLIMGLRLADIPLRQLLSDRKVYGVALLKLLICPFFMFLMLLPFQFDDMVKGTLVLLMAMPSASIIMALCHTYGGDGALAARSMLVNSLLSVITIPLAALLI